MQTHAFHVCISYKHHAKFGRPRKDFWLYPSNLLLFALLIEKNFFASSMLCLVLSVLDITFDNKSYGCMEVLSYDQTLWTGVERR